MAEWKKLLLQVRAERHRGQVHLIQLSGKSGICGRRAPETRMTSDINLITCLNCEAKRQQPATLNEILRNKGRFTKQQNTPPQETA